MGENVRTIFVCSDSVGETANTVVQATIRQFNASQVRVRRFGAMRSEHEISMLMEEASRLDGFVVYTLVLPELRETMRQEAIRLNVTSIDVLGPVMQAFIDHFNDSPKKQAGLLHQMDEAYYKRIEAIEFAVKCDDGKDAGAFKQADLVLLGISRTSKTPLSMYLAHKGYKAANYPLVPEVKPPNELFALDKSKLIGLTMNAEQLVKIRTERLKAVGLPFGAKYSAIDRVAEELEFAYSLYKQLGCRVIDVTERAIEETAGIILDTM